MKLINGDCLEEMDKLIKEGVKVDLILTDTPYGTTACKWDTVIPFEDMWERVNKLIKDNGAIVLFGSEPFSSALRMSNIKRYKYDWVWHKKTASNFLNGKHQPLKTTENIMVFSKQGKKTNYYPILEITNKDISKDKPVNRQCSVLNTIKSGYIYTSEKNKKGNERYPKHLIEFSNGGQKGKVHPTQKPVALLEYLIKTYTLENELVLDFTMGSGSTGVACKNTNRDFIGIELDEGYFEIAKNRIENK